MTHDEVMAVLSDELAKWDAPPPVELVTMGEIFSEEGLRRVYAPTPEETFRRGVRTLCKQIAQCARHFHDDDVSGWLIGVKPLLRVLIGWDANTELGQLAGAPGYMRMHARWNEAWDKEQERRRALSAVP